MLLATVIFFFEIIYSCENKLWAKVKFQFVILCLDIIYLISINKTFWSKILIWGKSFIYLGYNSLYLKYRYLSICFQKYDFVGTLKLLNFKFTYICRTFTYCIVKHDGHEKYLNRNNRGNFELDVPYSIDMIII